VEIAVEVPAGRDKDGVAFQLYSPTDRLAPRVDPGGHAVMSRRYQVLAPTAPVPAPDDVLEQAVREGPSACSKWRRWRRSRAS
jgi:hypothetical protein